MDLTLRSSDLRSSVADDQEDAVYNNIQVAELNALNAMLAVIVYKQKIGF